MLILWFCIPFVSVSKYSVYQENPCRCNSLFSASVDRCPISKHLFHGKSPKSWSSILRCHPTPSTFWVWFLSSWWFNTSLWKNEQVQCRLGCCVNILEPCYSRQAMRLAITACLILSSVFLNAVQLMSCFVPPSHSVIENSSCWQWFLPRNELSFLPSRTACL